MNREKQKKLGAFYTPDSLADEMVKKFESLSGNFVDFSAGDGSLLRALNRAGVDWNRLYANELDKDSYENLLKLNPDLPKDHVLNMDALDDECHKRMLEITGGQYQVILNPPFNKANHIVTKILEYIPDNKCVVLMPASQYRIKKLYEHVNNVEGIDSRVFANAIIGCNLSLTECYKEKVNKYTYQDILLACSDKEYYEYYKWNIEHNKNIIITALHHPYQLPPEFLSTDLDFVEIIRCCSIDIGGGFGKGGYGYRWNVTKADLDSSWLSWSFYIHFDTKLAKDNFAKWWYSDKKSKSLASKVLGGAPLSSVSNSISYTIPQIDWSNIHINQKELWDKSLYDEAVLAEMHLKWNRDKTKIVQV